MSRIGVLVGVAASCALAAAASARPIFPTNGHDAPDFVPFGVGTFSNPVNNTTMHQVFTSSLFSSMTGGLPAHILSIGFAPGLLIGTYNASVTINLGYTSTIPGQATANGGLDIPVAGGGGTPNATGAMSSFFANPSYSVVVTAMGANTFGEVVFPGNFIYDPNLGNLLVEMVVSGTFNNSLDMPVSRAIGSAEASRSYATDRFGNAASPDFATRMDFHFAAVPAPASVALLGLGGLVASRRRR